MAVAAMWGLWVAWSAAEERLATRRLAAIRHRVLCGGIRGKSSLTRLVHAGLRAAGLEALGRVTGGVPTLLLPDGSEHPQRRRGPANIREVRALLGSRLARGIDAAVIENMAIEPELQGVVARRFLRPTLQMLACDATDHLETLPADRNLRAAAILDGLDPKAPLAVANFPENKALVDLAMARGFHLVDSAEDEMASDHVEQVHLRPHIAPLAECAISGLRHLNCLTAESCNAVNSKAARLQQFSVFQLGESAWVNLMAANDPESTRRLMAGVMALDQSKHFSRRLILFNHRRDRPLRLPAFSPLFREYESAIIGDRVSRSRASRLGTKWVSSPPAHWKMGANLIFIVGNAGGWGRALCAALASEGVEEPW